MPIELEAKTFRIQEVILSPDDAKDVRFDITVNTKRNDRIVLEVENRKKFGELRLRYYMAKQDAWLLEKGKIYKELPDAYNIVVARHDIKGDGEPRYIMRMCYVKSLEEVGGNPSIVPDGKAAIYINAAYENEDDHSPLANLIHDFKCNDPEKMKNEILRKHSGILKQTKEGQDDMTTEIEPTVDRIPLFAGRLLTDEERMEERKEGSKEGSYATLRNMIVTAMKTKKEEVVLPVILCGNANHDMPPDKYKELVMSVAKQVGYQKVDGIKKLFSV